MAIEGDLRFGSHHDLMRATERVMARAKLPIRYTQGFNPHPVLSLACPRPVGVRAEGDLLVASLTAPIEADELLRRLNNSALSGMRFLRAESLPAGQKPQAIGAEYELRVPAERAEAIRSRRADLAAQQSWPVERLVSTKGRGKGLAKRTIDLKPLVADVKLDGEKLRMHLVPQGDLWARPGEVLRLLGLDEHLDLAALVRTEVHFGL